MRIRATAAALVLPLAAAALSCEGSDPDPDDPPATSTSARGWKALSAAGLRRTEVGAARIGKFIYVVGGFLPSTRTTDAVERYDIRRDRWRRVEPMPVAVNHPAVAAHRGKLYVFGGYTDSSFQPVTGALQRYDPRNGSWTLLANALHPRAAAALAGMGGELFAIGGVAGGSALDGLEIFDLASGRWRPGPSMEVAREHIAATVAGGRIYVVGGRSPNMDVVESYRPGAAGWQRMPSLLKERSGIAAVTVRGKPVVFGGEEEAGTIRPVELFDPDARRWHRLPGMRTPRHGLGGAALGRRVYAVEGGPSPGFAFSSRIEYLDVPRRLLR
jgi:N-acetylneuraminic acid mutarotase